VAVRGEDAAQQVLILHQLAPCLVWLRFTPAAPKGLKLMRGSCFSDEVRAWVVGLAGLTSSRALKVVS
jgi:hypothetical protein